MSKKIFYIYEWYNIDTNEVFYIGKGCGNRYKSTYGRNQKFLEYIKNNNVESRIVWQGDNEEEAFKKEIEYTEFYKLHGECSCNLAAPGKGGCQQIWTEEMRQYKSIYNPMKEEKQRERMRLYNPMHNKEIAKKVGEKIKRKVIINNQEFDGVIDASKYYKVDTATIRNWIIKGKSPNGLICKYFDNENFSKTTKKGTHVLVDGIEYPSITKAAAAIGVATSSLRTALLEKRKCKNHTCEYVNQQPSQ